MCPRCQSEEISRSRKWHLRDLFMRVCGMKPFRCRECQTRFYLPAPLGAEISARREWLHAVSEERDAPKKRHNHRSK